MSSTIKVGTYTQFIIETTADILIPRLCGYVDVGLNRATGLTKGSIYGNFEIKKKLPWPRLIITLKTAQIILQKMTSATTYRDN